VSAAISPRHSAIVAVGDADLAASLELALLAGGLNAFLFDPAQGLDRMPLDIAMTLIVNPDILPPAPWTFASELRRRPWDGLIVLITGDAARLHGAFDQADRVAVLEMPFVGADLINAIRRVWPDDDARAQP
jgi:hypothetical protein